MKKKAKLIPLAVVLILALALFCVNRYNTNKRRQIALDSIRSNIIGYVFSGTYEEDPLQPIFKYTFTFTDEETLTVKYNSKDWQGKNLNTATQDFGYKISVKGNEFVLKVGKPKNELSTWYDATRLAPSEGTFMLFDYSFEGEGVHNAVTHLKMSMDGSKFDYVYLDLKTPEIGTKQIMLPSDVRLD